MARDFTPSTTDGLSLLLPSGALSNSAPMTFLCRTYLDTKSAYRGFFELYSTGDVHYKHSMILSGGGGGATPLAYIWQGTEYDFGGPAINTGEWTALGMAVSTTDCALYTGTQTGAQNTATNTATHGTDAGATLDTVIIGRNNNDNSRVMDGRICECAIYLATLTADEILGFQRGFSPLQIRPASLTFYAPLVRDLLDRKSGGSMTATGTAIADHAPIIMPRRRGIVQADAAAAASTFIGARFQMSGVQTFSGRAA